MLRVSSLDAAALDGVSRKSVDVQLDVQLDAQLDDGVCELLERTDRSSGDQLSSVESLELRLTERPMSGGGRSCSSRLRRSESERARRRRLQESPPPPPPPPLPLLLLLLLLLLPLL